MNHDVLLLIFQPKEKRKNNDLAEYALKLDLDDNDSETSK